MVNLLHLWTSIVGVRRVRREFLDRTLPPHFPSVSNVVSKDVNWTQLERREFKVSELRASLKHKNDSFIEDITSLGSGRIELVSHLNQKFRVAYQFATTATQVYGGRTIGITEKECDITENCENIVVSVDDSDLGRMRLPIMVLYEKEGKLENPGVEAFVGDFVKNMAIIETNAPTITPSSDETRPPATSSSRPSSEQSARPSSTPGNPTSSPSFTLPSPDPTAMPTDPPTTQPSPSLTFDPSTRRPTFTPGSPTSPTFDPATIPTDTPTPRPSSLPTRMPAEQPGDPPELPPPGYHDICAIAPKLCGGKLPGDIFVGCPGCPIIPTDPVLETIPLDPVFQKDLNSQFTRNPVVQPGFGRTNIPGGRWLSRCAGSVPSSNFSDGYYQPVIDGTCLENLVRNYIITGMLCSTLLEYDGKKNDAFNRRGCYVGSSLANITGLALPFTYGLPDIEDADNTTLDKVGSLLIHGSLMTNVLVGQLERDLLSLIKDSGVSQEDFGTEEPPEPLPLVDLFIVTITWLVAGALLTMNNYGSYRGSTGDAGTPSGLRWRCVGLAVCLAIPSIPVIVALVNEIEVDRYQGQSSMLAAMSRYFCANQDPSWSKMVAVGCVRVTAMGYVEMHRRISNSRWQGYLAILILGYVLSGVSCFEYWRGDFGRRKRQFLRDLDDLCIELRRRRELRDQVPESGDVSESAKPQQPEENTREVRLTGIHIVGENGNSDADEEPGDENGNNDPNEEAGDINATSGIEPINIVAHEGPRYSIAIM